MKIAAGMRAATVSALLTLAFLSTSVASAQFRSGVIGSRPPHWASSVRGRILQGGLAIGLAVVLFRMLRPQVRRDRRKWNPDDLNCPENAKDFWDHPTDPGSK